MRNKMPKKLLKGIVVSDNPNKTITVLVERKYQHPILKKVIKTKKNIINHNGIARHRPSQMEYRRKLYESMVNTCI